MKYGIKIAKYCTLLLWVLLAFTQQWITHKANMLGLRDGYVVYWAENSPPVSVEHIKNNNETFAGGLFSFEAFYTQTVKGNGQTVTTEVVFTNQDLFGIYAYSLVDGVYWQDDAAFPGVVINEGLAWQLFGTSYAAGQRVELLDRVFTVVGVVAQKEVGKPYQAWVSHTYGQVENTVSTLLFKSYRQNQLVSYLAVNEFMAVNFPQIASYDVLDFNQYQNSFCLREQLLLSFGFFFGAVAAFSRLKKTCKIKPLEKKQVVLQGILAAVVLTAAIKLFQGMFAYFWFPEDEGLVKNVFLLFTNWGQPKILGHNEILKQLFFYNRWCNVVLFLGIVLTLIICFGYIYNLGRLLDKNRESEKPAE